MGWEIRIFSPLQPETHLDVWNLLSQLNPSFGRMIEEEDDEDRTDVYYFTGDPNIGLKRRGKAIVTPDPIFLFVVSEDPVAIIIPSIS